MKSKLETQLDKAFEQMNVRPWVYHVTDTGVSGGITIVAPARQDHNNIEDVVYDIEEDIIHEYRIEGNVVAPSTWMKERLVERGFIGISICDCRDTFSRKRGRTIAKGRLLKYLKGSER